MNYAPEAAAVLDLLTQSLPGLRPLGEEDFPQLLSLYEGNSFYNAIALDGPPTLEQCREDLFGLPPGRTLAHKLFLGLFISGTPEEVADSMAIAYHYLAVMSVCLPILYMLHIYRSALMGLGDTVIPMCSGIVEMVVRIGVAVLLPLVMGQEGIFYAEVGAWTGAAILLVISYYIRIYGISHRKGFEQDPGQKSLEQKGEG